LISFFALSKKQYVQTFDIMEYQSKESNRLFSASLRKRLVCMRQSYSEIEETTISLTSLVNERGSAQIQKITTSPHVFCLQLRVRGKTVSLYMGRGGDYLGLWLADDYLPAKFRVKKDKTVEYFKKEVKGLSIVGIEVDKEKEKSFSSFMGKFSNEALKDVIDEFIGDKKWKKEDRSTSLSEYFEKLDGMINSKKLIKKRADKIKKKISHIEKDIVRLKESQKFKDEIIKDNVTLENDFKVKGLKVKFDKSLGHYQRRDRVLTKLKDWKKAEIIQEERLSGSQKELESVMTGETESGVENIKNIKVNWKKGKGLVKETVSSRRSGEKGYDIFEVEPDLHIGIGKNSSGNDELRKNWGKKDDYWFHIEGEKGSHLILKGSLKPEHFNLIGSILRDYSKYAGLEIPVIYSTVGKIKGLTGKRGAVTISKPKYFHATYLENWREIIANGT
jgi:predicted ribosome quality control (RQC) complex YloA/Tae2 family protein